MRPLEGLVLRRHIEATFERESSEVAGPSTSHQSPRATDTLVLRGTAWAVDEGRAPRLERLYELTRFTASVASTISQFERGGAQWEGPPLAPLRAGGGIVATNDAGA